jgi:O-antigen/teichoic acid export membrane protein
MTAARAIKLPRVPKGLTVNALALMTATLGANALGLVFWAVAAHLRQPATVGRASAAIAALTLLSMIAGLNLTNVIIRLLLAAALLLLPKLGLTAVGWAYLGTQVALAAAVTPFTVRHLRRAEFRRASR